MNAKTQFISDKDLAAWWSSVSQDTRFDKVMLHASAAALEGCPSAEQREGILKFKDLLLTMSQPDAEPIDFAKPGLKHDLEVPRKTVADKPADKK